MYTSNDRSGRRNVIAAPQDRAEVAARVTEHLLGAGAHVVMLSFRSGADSGTTRSQLSRTDRRSSWTVRERDIPDYLPLKSTFDQTLSQIGKRTRTHMRYYRRRAEAELGCSFEPEVKITTGELLAFNRECMYSVPDGVAAWRLRALEEFDDPILAGTRDREGRWLSLVGGRRVRGDSEIFWQMNRKDLPAHSISLVMRTYFIEHEVSRGAQRLYLDGGSSHSIRHSFVKGTVIDLAVLRHTPVAFLVRKFGRRLIPPDNELADLLFDGPPGPAGYAEDPNTKEFYPLETPTDVPQPRPPDASRV
jgi:hypothetical protein